MNIIELVTGDDNIIDLQLRRNNQAVAVSAGATVRAAVTHDISEVTIGPVTCSNAASGADWDNGIIVIEIDRATSLTLPTGKATIEVEVDDGGRLTTYYYRHVKISEGRIENV